MTGGRHRIRRARRATVLPNGSPTTNHFPSYTYSINSQPHLTAPLIATRSTPDLRPHPPSLSPEHLQHPAPLPRPFSHRSISSIRLPSLTLSLTGASPASGSPLSLSPSPSLSPEHLQHPAPLTGSLSLTGASPASGSPHWLSLSHSPEHHQRPAPLSHSHPLSHPAVICVLRTLTPCDELSLSTPAAPAVGAPQPRRCHLRSRQPLPPVSSCARSCRPPAHRDHH